VPLQLQPDENTDCLICCRQNIEFNTDPGYRVSTCPRCGVWVALPAEPDAGAALMNRLHDPDPKIALRRRARLSHLVRRLQRPSWTPVGVPIAKLAEWKLDGPAPSPAEQANDLILWIGDHQDDYSKLVMIQRQVAPEVGAWVGAPLTNGDDVTTVFWLIESIPRAFLERGNTSGAHVSVQLTLAGWERYQALRREVRDNRRAFLAMKFNDVALDHVVTECFKPAAAAAGFSLETVLEGQPAGLIDDQMRVAIRTARFLVSDLTHGSHGAYWEAGFAEGLGRPVIYTCRKAEWDAQRSHFDTNHMTTVVWDPDNLADAAARLTATIRATLPDEAKME